MRPYIPFKTRPPTGGHLGTLRDFVQCGQTTTLARYGDRKNAYRNACVTYQMHLDWETSCREFYIIITCVTLLVVRFVDVLATFAWASFANTYDTFLGWLYTPYELLYGVLCTWYIFLSTNWNMEIMNKGKLGPVGGHWIVGIIWLIRRDGEEGHAWCWQSSGVQTSW